MTENLLFYGDNLGVLKQHIPDESVDLVYLDPPFNSAQNYNVLFAEQDGSRAAAQIQAFEDTWHWDQAAAAAFEETVEQGGKVADALIAFRAFLGDNDMLAYLSMMAPRLTQLHRVLRATGSLYLHCDPAASHYLKILLDGVFGVDRFGSEIIWKRSSAHNDAKQGRKVHGHIHDVILFYTKGEERKWNPQYTAYDAEYVEKFYKHIEEATGRRFGSFDITGPGGAAKGNPQYEVMGVTRFWRYSKEKMNALIGSGRVYQPKPGAVPREKRYLDEMPGIALQDLWVDIPPISAQAAERLGYPTQKPEALLERIIATSSDEGDTVLDPFCGCGTTIAAAQKLNRRWIGIDVTHLAVSLIKTRLKDAFQEKALYRVVGEPTTTDDAAQLAESDPYQFQWWALGLVGARPADQKKGADKGIDGRLYFHGETGGKTEQMILSVKAGKVQASHVRDLVGTVAREKAAIGALISFEAPTKPMRQEAASAGFFETPWGKYPRIQLLTVQELLEGKRLEYPAITRGNLTFKAAPKAAAKVAEAPTLWEAPEADPPRRVAEAAEPPYKGSKKKPRKGK